MKKLMYVAVVALALGFTSCGSDDDGGCPSCDNGPVSISVCDNGDGTYSIEGGTPIEIPEGQTFDDVFAQACSFISAN